MRDLYRALATLALDETLRIAVDSLPDKTIAVPEFGRGAVVPDPQNPTQNVDLGWENQPSEAAMAKIAVWLRPRGLFLAAYELGEVVRLASKPDFLAKLGRVGETLVSEGLRLDKVSSRDLVLIGALLVDKTARVRLRNGTFDQEWFGYGDDFGPIQAILLRVFPEGARADLVATAIYDQGWSPEVCLVSQEYYPGMFFLNA